MYARVTTFHADPARLDEMVATIEGLKADVKAIAGVVEVYSAWRADGHGVTTAIYESQEAAEASTPQVQAIWGGLVGYLTAPPQATTFENVEHLTG
ncbi:MAG: hypothetical protein ACR2OR_11070 [Hyphomicrobiales bacterium]